MKKILLVASSGGHLSELRSLSAAWQGHECKVASYPSENSKEVDFTVKHIGGNPFRMLAAFWSFFWMIRKFKPDCVISTGSEIALPAMFWGKILGAKTLYIECSARVTSASLTGKLLLNWVHSFWVQWPETKAAFSDKAEYHGGTL